MSKQQSIRILAAETLRKGGLTYGEIAEILNVSESRARYLGNPDTRRKAAVHHKNYQRRHQISTRSGFIFGVKKRPRPDDTCELCGRNVTKLDYHHWDDTAPYLGLWLCVSCHIFADRIDKGMVDKYLALKESINGNYS